MKTYLLRDTAGVREFLERMKEKQLFVVIKKNLSCCIMSNWLHLNSLDHPTAVSCYLKATFLVAAEEGLER